jgi:hypothetical protein
LFKGADGKSNYIHVIYAKDVQFDSNGKVTYVALTDASGEVPGK